MGASRATPAELAYTLKAVRGAKRQLALELETARTEIAALRCSTSWRITAPLRALVGALSRIRRKKNVVSLPAASEMKGRFRAVAARRLSLFLASGARIAMPTSAAPDVSIVIVLYNGAELTMAHLKSLVPALAQAKCEVIIVDNASTDRTHELLARVDGARIILNDTNLHFLRAVNEAAQLARGRQLLLVNNDTEIEPDSIAIAHRLIEADGTIGAIGGKIVLRDGTLQEAGCIIWNDGSASGYGRGADPDSGAFGFRRDVDYCSGAFLMISRALFEQLGGFDERYAPAYYEETDLCMRIRAAGYRVVFEPTIRVVHFEFGSAASTEEPFSLQARNRELFRVIHRATLQANHFPSTTPPLIVSSRHRGPRLLVIADRLPIPAYGALDARRLAMVEVVLSLGWAVSYYTLRDVDAIGPAVRSIMPAELEMIIEPGLIGLRSFMLARQGIYDAILVAATTRLDLPPKGTPMLFEPPILTLPSPVPTPCSACQRGHDILFRPASGQAEDIAAIEMLVIEIMPALDRMIGTDYRLVVAGRVDWDELALPDGARIVMQDDADDIEAAFARCRLLIAPSEADLAVLEAAAYGLPSVVSSQIAERLGFVSGRDVMVAPDPIGMSAACATLYSDDTLADRIAAAARLTLRDRAPQSEFIAAIASLLSAVPA